MRAGILAALFLLFLFAGVANASFSVFATNRTLSTNAYTLQDVYYRSVTPWNLTWVFNNATENNYNGMVMDAGGTNVGTTIIGSTYQFTCPSTGSNGQGNLTKLISLSSGESNTSFYYSFTRAAGSGCFATYIANGYSGASKRYYQSYSVCGNAPSEFSWLYYNSSNQSTTWKIGGATTTYNTTNWGSVYLVASITCGAGVSQTFQYESYINTTYSNMSFPNFTTLYQYSPVYFQLQSNAGSENVNASGLTATTVSHGGKLQWNETITNLYADAQTYPTSVYNYSSIDAVWVHDVNPTKKAQLYYRVLDESNPSATVVYTSTVINGTNSTTYPIGSVPISVFYDGVANGNLTISLTNGSSNVYYARTYNISFNNWPSYFTYGLQNQTFYMLKVSATTGQTTFFILNSAGKQLQGASVSIYRQMNGVYTLLETTATDSVGSATFNIDRTATYQITVSATGYFPLTTTVVPSQTSYTLYLSTTSSSNFTSLLENVTFNYFPTTPVLSNSSGNFVTVSLNVTSGLPILAGYGFNFTLENGTTICGVAASNTLGGYQSCSFNSSNLTGYGTAVFWLNRTDVNGTYYAIVTYSLNEANYGFMYSARLLSLYWPKWSLFLLSIALALFATIAVSRYLGFGSVLVTLAVLGACTFAGLFDMLIFIILCLLAAGLLVTGRLAL